MEITMNIVSMKNKSIEKAELDRIMEEHKKWLADRNIGKRADLSGLSLCDMDLSGKDFSYANMEGVDLMGANLSGANLSHAYLRRAYLMKTDLSKATLVEADFSQARIYLSNLDECVGDGALFVGSRICDCSVLKASLKKAGFLMADVYDNDFKGSDLEKANFAGADMDNTGFSDTILKNANLMFANRTYWSDFTNADMTGARTEAVDFDPELIKGVKGLDQSICCPEEGSFIAWKKCREGKVVKLLIPEQAERKGNTRRSLRASEAVVLEIYDKEGNPDTEAYGLYDEEFKYVKGEKVSAGEADYEHRGDVAGIYFFLSRKEAEDMETDQYGDYTEET